MESPAFFIFLFIHLTMLIMAFGSVIVLDHFGLRWMRNRIPFPRLLKVAGTTQKLVWIGWIGLVASGIPLIIFKGEIDRLMVIKFAAVALAGLNGLGLHLLLQSLSRYEQADSVPSVHMVRLGLSLFVSQCAWWTAFIIGFLHRHIWSVIEQPQQPWLWIGAFIMGVLALWIAGEALLRKKPSRVQVTPPEKASRVVRGPGPTVDPLGKKH